MDIIAALPVVRRNAWAFGLRKAGAAFMAIRGVGRSFERAGGFSFASWLRSWAEVAGDACRYVSALLAPFEDVFFRMVR
jgi:hypothetical protein